MNVLQGIRVIDVTQNIAGPHSTQTLGDLGADVIKIEPPGGDPTRSWGPPFWEGEPPLFLSYNRNKRSVVIDAQTEMARAGYAKAIEDSRRITDISVKLAEEAAQPLTKQVSATVEKFSKPIAA